MNFALDLKNSRMANAVLEAIFGRNALPSDDQANTSKVKSKPSYPSSIDSPKPGELLYLLISLTDWLTAMSHGRQNSTMPYLGWSLGSH
eukprot:scaffold471408_cov38-Prasinocladus_malaysianus.AAC.1